MLPGPVAALTKRCKSCFIYWFDIYIFFFLQMEMVTCQTPSLFIVCNAFIVMGYIQIAADWLKPPTHPLNERKCGPKSMLPKTCRFQLKKKNKTKTRQKMAKVLLVWLNLTFINFIKILKKTLSKCNI